MDQQDRLALALIQISELQSVIVEELHVLALHEQFQQNGNRFCVRNRVKTKN